MIILRVALSVPLHRLFEYRWEGETGCPRRGQRVRVPFGSRERIGVIVDCCEDSERAIEQLKPAHALCEDTEPLPEDFFRLCEFASSYYQAPLGEVILQALPAGLRRLDPPGRRAGRPSPAPWNPPPIPVLTAEQAAAVASIHATSGFAVHLLYGVTGSGKTEVYLRLIEAVLAKGGQVLLLVPEINLTPQLEARVFGRFSTATVVALHSELADAARERHWRAAFDGKADIVLGTRLAVFTPMPRLQLVVIDEEHDLSFKQQDAMRYSARDLAVVRARQAGIPVVLGSATPSLESWANAQAGRYGQVTLRERAYQGAQLPAVRLLDIRRSKLQEGMSDSLIAAIDVRLERREQSLIFLNRRGYAPVLACTACGWVSHCQRCAANLVVHLADRRLRCHHCGFEAPLPVACPTCGNQDVMPFGRGTQRIESHLQARFPGARILRVDRDAARSRKQWEAMLARIHGGEADILVGTQMLAKGHDFPNLTLVGMLGADAALFAADWRAPERLFCQMMQVAGRAGRAERPGEVLIQTQYPEHALFRALVEHDYEGFAASQLGERRQAGFPPFSYQAMLRAEAPEMSTALAFLGAARSLWEAAGADQVTLYDPVPMHLFRLANLERAQLLVESTSRRALQEFLPTWRMAIEKLRTPARLRWHLEVDPVDC